MQFDDDEEVPEELRHVGVRVEDTLLYVDTKTVDVLTKESPRVDAGGTCDCRFR